jgi:tRNA A-37 threonylcarbamoyl transferase component Bud32/outer membrane biosynthesis protein TonB
MDRIGRYKIVRELGRGAMGVVYHAIDPNIGRPVAIKTIDLGGVRKPEEQERLRERLFREARSAGSLSHPGIVTIYDVEQQGALAYIAMEFVDGVTLDHLLSGTEPISAGRMFAVLGQTATALDYAHQKGIVHRDIKPANIMIAGDGNTKITDFGIAKITTSEQLTMTGSIVGTPHYMSPEQVQGQAVDGRSDQFSLAVIAFEMLTGEKPYMGEHVTTVVYKIVAEEPMAPQRLNPSLGPAIEGVIRKGLAKKPDARYRTCQEFTSALEKACAATKGWKILTHGGGLSAPTVAEMPAPAVALPPSRRARRLETTTTDERPRKAGFFTFVLAVLVAAGLLALIGWQAAPWITRSGQKAPPAAEAQPQPPAEPTPTPTAPPQQAAAPPPEEAKPSPMTPVEADRKAEAKAPVDATEAKAAPKNARLAEVPQSVMIISSPGGATATLDGRQDASCRTPCALDAPPGRHSISVTLPGYNVERREVDVGSSPIELPAFVLRAPGGTLMLSSAPSGAAVLVDGRATGQTTPAEVKLTAGTHKITVQKDGREGSQTVEIKTGISSLRILLGQ